MRGCTCVLRGCSRTLKTLNADWSVATTRRQVGGNSLRLNFSAAGRRDRPSIRRRQHAIRVVTHTAIVDFSIPPFCFIYLSELKTMRLYGWKQPIMESVRWDVVDKLSLNDVCLPDIMLATRWFRMKSPTVKTHESPPEVHSIDAVEEPCLCDGVGLRRQ